MLLLAFAMLIPMSAGGEIFKWVDDAGNVHFSDTPHEDRQTEEVNVNPTPSEEAVREAQDRADRLKEFERTYGKSKEDVSETEEPRRADKRPSSYSIDVDCFTPVGDSWGGRVSDSLEEVVRRKLSQSELRQVKELLSPLKKRWWTGVQVGITCISPQATPSTKIRHYDLRLRARWESDDFFGMDAELVQQEHGQRYKQFYWFFIVPEGLRFRSATSDIFFEIDLPGNDVEVLTISNTELTFFRRMRGRVRKVIVFSLRRSGAGFTLTEFFYTQGILSGKQHWVIGR